MSYSQLSMLNEVLTEKEITLITNYFENLTPDSAEIITISKIIDFTGININKVIKAVEICVKNEILIIHYGIRCPECGLLINQYDDLETVKNKLTIDCYGCDEVFEVTEDSIVYLFSINKSNNFFHNGQHCLSEYKVKLEMPNAALMDTKAFLDSISNSLCIIANNSSQNLDATKESKKIRRNSRKYKMIINISFIILALLIFCFLFKYINLVILVPIITVTIFLLSYISNSIINVIFE